MFIVCILCVLMGILMAVWLPLRLLTPTERKNRQELIEVSICGFVLGLFIFVSFPMLVHIAITRK